MKPSTLVIALLIGSTFLVDWLWRDQLDGYVIGMLVGVLATILLNVLIVRRARR